MKCVCVEQTKYRDKYDLGTINQVVSIKKKNCRMSKGKKSYIVVNGIALAVRDIRFINPKT